MSTEDLPTAPGAEAFARLEAREPMSIGSARAAAESALAYRETTSVAVADDALRGAAATLGFRWVGCYRFDAQGDSPSGPRVREAWVDPLGVVRVSMRRAVAEDRVEAKVCLYYLSTTFDDGAQLTTWSRTPAPLLSFGRNHERGGTGIFSDDYAAHLASVRAYAAGGPHPLTLPDLATILRAAHWDHYHLRPGRIGHGTTRRRLTSRDAWLARLTARLGLVLLVAMIVWRLYRWFR